jgi:hypothetical protein
LIDGAFEISTKRLKSGAGLANRGKRRATTGGKSGKSVEPQRKRAPTKPRWRLQRENQTYDHPRRVRDVLEQRGNPIASRGWWRKRFIEQSITSLRNVNSRI